MMLGLHEQMRDEWLVANESIALVHAMKACLSESDPTFEARFEKHYLGGATTAVLRQSQADKLAALDSLIAELRKLAD